MTDDSKPLFLGLFSVSPWEAGRQSRHLNQGAAEPFPKVHRWQKQWALNDWFQADWGRWVRKSIFRHITEAKLSIKVLESSQFWTVNNLLEINLVAPDQISQRAIEWENVFQVLRLSAYPWRLLLWKCHTGHEGIPLLEFWYKKILEEERRLQMSSSMSSWRGEWLRIHSVRAGCGSWLLLLTSCLVLGKLCEALTFPSQKSRLEQGQHLRQRAASVQSPAPLWRQKQPLQGSWLSW